MANLVPLSSSSLVKSKKSAIIKADKFLAKAPKSSSAIVKYSGKSSQTLEGDNTLKEIQKKVIRIDNLLKDSLVLSKKEEEKKRVGEEQKDFDKREKELEKNKPKAIPGIKLPSLPKMGFLDWIKNFVTQTILGFFAVRLIEHLPKLLSLLPAIIKVSDFIVGIGGKLLDGLITFVDWGYKAIDGTRGFIKNIGGESWAQNFDKFVGAVDNVLTIAMVAALATADSGSGGDRGGPGGGRRGSEFKDPRKGFKGKQGWNLSWERATNPSRGLSHLNAERDIMKRYFQKYGRDQFIQRFGQEGLKELPGGMARSGLAKLGRNAFVGLAGKGGAKAILKFTRPLLKRLPIIGALIDFGLSVALGEPLGRAAFKAIGAGLLGAVGAAIGSVVPIAGNIVGGLIGGIAGDAIGGALYDMFFSGKKPRQSRGKVAKAAGGGSPSTRGGKLVGGPRRTLKKKKKPRTLSFTPRKIKPGTNVGGEAKVQQVFPNPEKAWWDPLGVFTGKPQQSQQTKKPKGKQANPQEFLVGSNDVLGRAKHFMGPAATLVLKTVLGQEPDDLDYKNIAKGLSSFVQTTFNEGTLGFAGGGEVDARQYFSGEDYTDVIAKTIKDSASKEVDATIRNLSKELSLRPVGKEEMRDENIRRGTEGGDMQDATLSESEMDLFQRLVYAESGGEGKTGMSLVARSVLNRAGLIQSGKATTGTFSAKDNTVTGVIMGSGQYTPVTNGRINDQRSQKQMDDAKEAIKLAQDPEKLKALLKSEGIDDGSIKKLLASTGFRNYNAGAGYDASQAVNEVRYKRHTFNTAGNRALIVASSQVSERITSVPLSGGDGRFIQGNSGASEGIHFHIGPGTQPGQVDTRYNADARAAASKVVKHFLGKKSLYDGRRKANYTSGSDDEILSAQRAHSASGSQGGIDIQVGGAYDPGAKLPFPFAVSNMAYRPGGFGVSAKINGLNAFVAHGRYDEKGRIAKQEIGPNLYAFHGMNKVMSKDGLLKFHKGEFISVTDADSFRLVGNILMDINSIENQSQLIAKAPSIIERLKKISGISGYADYEHPYGGETQIVYLPGKVVYQPIGSGSGGTVFVGDGGDNYVNSIIEQAMTHTG